MTYTTKDEAHVESETYYQLLVGSMAGKTGLNDDVDAFRHAYTSAVYAWERGATYSKILGWANEVRADRQGAPATEHNMDMWNNKIGIELAAGAVSKAQIAQRIADALANGDLIVDPDEPGDKIYDEDAPLYADVCQTPVESGDLDPEPDDYANYSGTKALPDWIPDVTGPFAQSEQQFSPLVLDLAGTGVNLAALGSAGSVYWNFSLTDFAHASGWIAEGSGLLTIDLNEDGVINDHSELFGTETTDGFTVLSAYDSNSDDVVNSSDSAWADLLVWTDGNSDGYSQADELHTLNSLGITSINLNATQVNYDIAGNHITHESTFTINGQQHTVVDAWFDYDVTNTDYVGDYDLDIRALFLPTARGYGQLPDLHIAMSQDEDLLDMVQALATADLLQLMDPAYDLQGKVQDILFQWAGVQNVDPDSRGPYIDARVLGFLEAFIGRDYIAQNGSSSDPVAPDTAGLLMDAFWTTHTAISTRLLVQSAGAGLFSEPPAYDVVQDTISSTVVVDVNAIDTLSSVFDHTDVVESIAFWKNILRRVDQVVGLVNLDQNTIDSIDTVIQSDDLSGQLDYEILAGMFGTNGSSTVGDSNANLLVTDKDDLTVYGYAGNDLLVANRVAAQKFYGGGGDDTYVYSPGDGKFKFGLGYNGYGLVNENLNEGADTIRFTTGISPDEVRMWADSSGNLYISFSPADHIRVTASSAYLNGAYMTRVGEYVERIEFADETVWNLTGGLHLKSDNAGRSNYGSAYDDIIEGGAGNDTLFGGNGDDTLIGNGGYDARYGGVGNDTYVLSIGHASNNGSGWTNSVNESLSAGTDTLLFTAGIDAADVRLWTDSNGHLYIKYSETDTIRILASVTVSNGVYQTRVGEYVERIVFSDETVWDLTPGLYLKNDDTGRQIYGSVYDDRIEGGAGNDYVYSGSGADILTGGVGQDYLYGGIGNDIYEFYLGGASNGGASAGDQVNENLSEGTDRILFGAGIDAEDVLLWTDSSGHLYIKYSANDYIRVQGSSTLLNGAYHSRVGEYLEIIEFDDQTMWDLTAGLHLKNDDIGRQVYGSLYNDIIEGGAGNDSLYGGNGDDTLIGNGGYDSRYGGIGNDTYVFSFGHAANSLPGSINTVNESLNAGTDTLLFTAGIDADNVRLWTDSNGHLYIKYSETDTIRVSASQTGGASRVGEYMERIEFADETVWDLTAGLHLKNDDTARTLYGTTYGDVIEGGTGNDTLNGYGGNDTLVGKIGNDFLSGADGDDLFIYSSGQDTVTDTAGTDTLWITGGITVNDVSFASYSTYHTKITVTPTTDVITVNNLRHGTASNHVDMILFDDGFYANLPSYNSWLNGTSGNDAIAGNANDNVLVGKGGNDTINCGGGADNAHGGTGNDTIHGDGGNDLIHGGEGDDVLYGDDGLDTLFGGAGADTFKFETASAFNNVDVIKDFSVNDNDLLDLSEILTAAYDPLTDAITDFVEMTTSGYDTILKVDRDGTGGTYSMTQIALLEGVTGLTDEEALETSGHLLAA